jgi:very-short-patch-repair endonuclease
MKFSSHPKSKYWNYKKNANKPNEVGLNSNRKYWFECDKCIHSFDMKLKHINYGSWCPYCANRKLCNCNECYQKTFDTNLKSKYWNYNKNKKKPNEVFLNSNKKYWFDCDKCKHIFDSKLSNINKNNTWCPYCVNIKMCECNFCYKNSFASHPKSKYWNYNKNSKKPSEVFLNSNKKYWFDCIICNHTFNITLGNINNGNWCSYCTNRKICNCNICYQKSFASHPKSKYWNYNKNNKKPNEVFLCISKKYWFNCNKCDFLFDMRLSDISLKNNWCPKCNFSKGENKIYEILNNDEIISQFNPFKLNNTRKRYDFYLKKYNLIIEYDGINHFEYTHFFHKNRKKYLNRKIADIFKNKFALENNYNILRISYLEYNYIDTIILSAINRIKNGYNGIIFSNPKLYKNSFLN